MVIRIDVLLLSFNNSIDIEMHAVIQRRSAADQNPPRCSMRLQPLGKGFKSKAVEICICATTLRLRLRNDRIDLRSG
jgi:hypothetical protein